LDTNVLEDHALSTFRVEVPAEQKVDIDISRILEWAGVRLVIV
jgi:hypothetical protein